IWGRNGRFSLGYLPRTIPSEVLGNSPTAFHVSTRGEYGMRLMVDLARHWGQGTVSLHAVAQREDLPEAYLEQLVAALRKAGLVNGKRGAGGGYTLAREPREITAGDVVRALEGPIEPQICTAEGEPVLNCVREPDCGTRAVWLKLQDSIAKALDGMTLAELATTTTRERVSVEPRVPVPIGDPGRIRRELPADRHQRAARRAKRGRHGRGQEERHAYPAVSEAPRGEDEAPRSR